MSDDPIAKRQRTAEGLAEHYDALQSRQNKSGLGLGKSESPGEANMMQARDVAAHYNLLTDRHRTLDSGSDILHVRNLHNWIKAVLIGRYMRKGCRCRPPVSMCPAATDLTSVIHRCFCPFCIAAYLILRAARVVTCSSSDRAAAENTSVSMLLCSLCAMPSLGTAPP